METVFARYRSGGSFKTFRNIQRNYTFRGFFKDNDASGYKKNTFSIMTTHFSDNLGTKHDPGTVYFNGPDKSLRYNINVKEFFDRFEVHGKGMLARRKEERRLAIRVTDRMLNEVVTEERKSGITDMTVSSVTVKLPWDGSLKRLRVGDFILSHRVKKPDGSLQQQYIPVDSDAFLAIYIEDTRNIRSVRRLKASEQRKAIAPEQTPVQNVFPFGNAPAP
jgi:hypothetical protein